ncbi:MAG: Na(+)/H(+) antiporter subunit A [Gammaproteobacteria bacterium]|nr:MAG: Na(+)/H(+) antiporter subunit A [Gammaproteobacteria bacterium]|tara:strand:+ start:6397 stop:6867 length:471 start_codon:yes stop_codon:yes gene_type:complete
MLTRDLFSAIMATTVFSLICALIFLLLDGIDVSLTEAAVGAGISTILFLSTLKHTNVEIKASRKSSIPLVVLFLLTLSLLIYAISDLPDFGKSIVTTNSEVTRHYINESKNEMGIPNMVTSILAGYRGFDTLGEVVVIFIAGISVLGILREKKENK